MHLNVFLVIYNRLAYLVCWQPETQEFGYMCPCCMDSTHRSAIMRAVYAETGNYDGKVRWCCHKSDSNHGDHLEGYKPLVAYMFCAGSANSDLVEMKTMIHEEASRQLSAGVIQLWAS